MCSSYWFALASIVGVVNTRSLPRAKHEWKHAPRQIRLERLPYVEGKVTFANLYFFAGFLLHGIGYLFPYWFLVGLI